NPSDLPFSLLSLTDREGRPRLCASTGVARAPDPDLWPLARVALGQQVESVEDVPVRFPAGEAPPSRAALLLPLAQAAQVPAGCLVAGVRELLALGEAYRGFFDLVAAQIATAIAGAGALEEERGRAEALAAFDAAKTTFLANVSHELCTPLSLVLAPLEE